MTCPRCRELDFRSTVTLTSASSSGTYDPPRWDEDGNRVNGKSTPTEGPTEYACSEGHRFTSDPPT